MEEALKDGRFSHILTDPRFRKMPRNVSKVAIDKRFKGMFKDKKFKGRCVLDKRGRPLDLTTAENLKKLYEVSSESSENDDENNVDEESNDEDINCLKTSDEVTIGKTDKKAFKNEKELPNKFDNISKADKTEKNKDIKSSKDKKNNVKKSNSTKQDGESKKSIDNINEGSSDSEKVKFKQIKIASSCEKESVLKDKSKKAVEVKVKETESDDDNDISSEGSIKENDSSEESDDSDESESGDSSDEEKEEFDHHWEELRNEAPDTDEITRRFAVCNMDWDRIRAEDLFACFESFKSANGCINSVKIYPSEYGIKRMEEEKINGPLELVEETLPLDEEEETEDKKGSKYHREKLRQYQINRLKYYYAVVDCDTSETANTLYEQLNGMEYESSSIRFDLRFIPDDVTFEHEPISTADKVSDPTEYKPRLFFNSALQQVKVNLTWDETDPKRRETLQKAFKEPDNIEKDIHDYLASSSGESEEEEVHATEDTNAKLSTKDRITKYKELLLSLEEKEKEEENKYEMEITWEPGLKEKTEEVVKEKLKRDQLNPFEEKLQKKKEERKLKKKEQKAMKNQSDDEHESVYSDDDFFSKNSSSTKDEDSKRLAELTLISDSKKELLIDEKSGKKNKKSRLLQKIKQKTQKDNFKLDVNDPRFSAIYSSHLYNIDPSDPHYKDTDGNRALIQEKQRKLKSTGFGDRNNIKKTKHF